jgi:hypothetical protein
VTVPDASQAAAAVCVLNGTPTSAGNGPGVATLPWDEASRLVALGYACWGTTPPTGMGGSLGPVSPL